MSEELIIRNCAPTMAGLKTGNLFSCTYPSAERLREELRRFNRRLRGKGISAIPLRMREGSALIYVYRASRLRKDLGQREARALLERCGYPMGNPAGAILHLRRRLSAEAEFPHEIGLFLGYPPEDVRGFIENRAEACRLVGAWKVYGDEEAARRLFARFKKCTDVYLRRWREGYAMERLTLQLVSP